MGKAKRIRLEAPLNVDLPVDVLEGLRKFCDTHRIKIKLVAELSFRQFLATHQSVKQ